MKKILFLYIILSVFAFGSIKDEYKKERLEIEKKFKTEDDIYIAYNNLLNKYYNRLLNDIKKEDRENLKSIHKRWLNLRDRENQFNKELGSDKGKIEMTKRRIEELVQYIAISENEYQDCRL